MSTESDRDMREAALAVVRHLKNVTHRAAAIRFTNQNDGSPIFLPIAYLDTPHQDLLVGVTFGIPNAQMFHLSDDLESTLPKRFRFGVLFPCDPAALLLDYGTSYCRSLEHAKRVATAMVRDAPMIAETLEKNPFQFIHEFTHYWDMSRSLRKGVMLSPSGFRTHGPVYYANTPMERNAYYNEILAIVEHHLPEWFDKPFQKFSHSVLGLLHPEYYSNLTETNRRRWINRLYQAWQLHCN